VRLWSFGKLTVSKNTQRLKANAMGFYPLRGESSIYFASDSKQESFIEFLKELRERNREYKVIVVILDNFKTHHGSKVKEEAEKLGIRLVYLPPYAADLNPIEFIWKSIKRVISISFVKELAALRELIKDWFLRLAKQLSFAHAWIQRFLPYMEFCK